MQGSQDFAERRWTSADGLSLYARDYPGAAGPARLPLVCIHGLTRNSADFEDVAPRIAAGGRRVLALDIRGRGSSDRDPKPMNYVPKTYARDVVALLDALGIAKAVFLGTSMGGIIIMMIAALRPRAISAAIFNDVGPEIAPEGLARIKAYAGKPVEIGDWDAAAAYMLKIMGAAFPEGEDWMRMARRTFREADGRLEPNYDPAIMQPLARAPGKAVGLIAWMLFRRVARHKPTLLIRGARSDIVSTDIARRMKRSAPRLEVAEVPGVGHAPMLTEPVAVAAMEGFLARVD